MTPNLMKDTYTKLLKNIESTGPADENTKQLVFTLAKIVDEEQALQDIVDSEGMIYTTTGDKGQNMIKTRPEYIELQRLRDKKRAYIKALGVGNVDTDDPDFA